MAHGDSYNSLAHRFRIHPSTVSLLIPDVCQVIYDTLQPTEMPNISQEKVGRHIRRLQEEMELPQLHWSCRWEACHNPMSTQQQYSMVQLQG